MNKKWIVLLTALILSISTYWSLSFASEAQPDVPDDKIENDDGVNGVKEEVENVVEEEFDVNDYLTSIFINKGITIGFSKEELFAEHGTPESKGMYEGGHFFDYDFLTYFVNPDTEKVVAIALSGDGVSTEDWVEVEGELADKLKVEGMNEMEGLWMEIYDWMDYDIMIERESADAPPYYIWLMEDGLFTE